jgi:plastocyanin
MKGARALAGAAFMLAAVSVAPAVSAAQDSGSPAGTSTTPTAPTLPSPGDATGAVKGSDPAPSDAGASQAEATSPAAPPVTRSASAHASASATVTMGDNFFSPSSVTIAVGDTVTWKNNGQAPHTATANNGSFDTGTIQPGGSGSHTFNSAGTFPYICTIHANMTGTVRVLASSSGGGGGGGGGGTGSSSSGQTEAAAVTSPDAAGTSSTLPMTGLAVGALATIGLALLASGMIVRRLDPQGERRGLRFLTIF